MDGGSWWAAVHGVAKSRTRLNDFTFNFHFHALEKEMATHSSVLAWRIPGKGSLVGCRLWGRTESDRTEVTSQQQQMDLRMLHWVRNNQSQRLHGVWLHLLDYYDCIHSVILLIQQSQQDKIQRWKEISSDLDCKELQASGGCAKKVSLERGNNSMSWF